MPTNQFYEFATSSAAYVETLPDYITDVERVAGQQSGVARAELNNRALRQGSAMAAAIGSFMTAQGYDALDDGDTATRAADFAAAVAALIQPDITAAVNAAKINVLQTVFPVGSIYTSYNVNTNPASRLGFGTWVAIQGRMLIGASSAYPATSTGGAATHTLTVSEMPSHSHTGSSASAGSHSHGASTSSAGAHTHTVSGTAASAGSHTHTATIDSAGAHTHTVSGSAARAGAHTHTITVASGGAHTHTASTASAGAHTHTRGTMEITGSLSSADTEEFLIYADNLTATGAITLGSSQSGKYLGGSSGGTVRQSVNFTASRSWSGATSSAGAHTHTVTVTNTNSAHSHTASSASAGAHTHDVSGTAASAGAHSHTVTVASAGAHTHSVTGTAASAGAHTHTVTINTNGAHTHTISIGNTGSGTGFSTISPYLAVYMWRRTA